MIKRSGDYREELREYPGLDYKIPIRHRFEAGEMFGKSRLCAEILLEPGQGFPKHAHVDEVEFYYMVEGELMSLGEDGSKEAFRKGDIMVTGGGASHQVVNEGDCTAVMLAVIAI